MAIKKWAKKLILAKIESSYGTDPTATGSANAILARNVTPPQVVAQARPRNLVKPTLGKKGEPHVMRHATMGFDVELAGAGAAGTAPKYGPLLRACALSETVDAGVDVEYAPVSAAEESASFYWYLDGLRQILVGARGTCSFVLEAGEVPLLRFGFMGLYAKPTDTALATPDFTAFQYPKAVSDVNTPTFTLDSYAHVMRSLDVNLNIDRVFRDLVNTKRVDVTGREQGVTGTAVVECPAMADEDLEALMEAETQVALQLVHGSAGGAIVQLDAPKVQITSVNREEIEGLAYARLGLLFNENAGNDEVLLTIK